MRLFNKNIKKNPIIVAEIGINHEGSFIKAKKLIKLAKENGADAVKFQSFTPENYISSSDPTRLKRIKKFCLSDKDFIKLSNYCKKIKISFFSTPITIDYVKKLNPIVEVFKISSGDFTFKPLIKECIKTKKPIILSTGLSDTKTVQKTLNYIKKIGGYNYLNKIVLMHCVSAYPVPLEDVNLYSINYLKQKFKTVIGYSNHALGTDVCKIALMLGASIIEVHFTDKRKGKKFHDHKLSYEPSELQDLVNFRDNYKMILGSKNKKIKKSEIPFLKHARKGICYKKDLKKNTVITFQCLTFLRPAEEFLFSEVNKILGKKLKYNVCKNEITRKNDFYN